MFPYNAPVEFLGAERTKIALTFKGVGREHAELKIGGKI